MKTNRTIRYTLSNTDMTIIYARKDEHGTRQKMWTMLNEIIASDCPAVGFDIETYKMEEFKTHPKAGLAPRLTGIRLLQFYLPDGRCYIFDAYHDEEHVLSLLAPVFKRKTVIGHYVQFDLAHLRRYVKYPIKAHCTQIMYNTYRHASFVDADDEEARSIHDVDWLTKKDTHSASLRYITGTLLGIQVDKNMQTSNWNAEELTQEQLVYAAADVKYTYDCAKVLGKYIKKLKAENELLQFKLNDANGVIARQIDYIGTLNRQLEQQDLYMNRYMDGSRGRSIIPASGSRSLSEL